MNNFTQKEIRLVLKEYNFYDKQGDKINLLELSKAKTRFNNSEAVPFYRLVSELSKEYYYFNSACVFKMVENLEKIIGDIKIERVGF